MKVVRPFIWIGVGMVLAAVLIYGVNSVTAQGIGGLQGWGHMGMGNGMGMMHGQMNGDMTAMHARMHNSEAMPTECATMMNDPEIHEQMMQRMHSGTPVTLEEAQTLMQTWMDEADIPEDVQQQCLDHMATHHSMMSTEP